MDPADYEYILTLCASCGSHIKETYTKLLGEEPGLSVKAQQFIDKLIDFSSFLTQELKVDAAGFKGGKGKVAYHSPCHLCRGMGVMEEPRELLALAGLDYRPAKDEDVCCGMAGGLSLDFPELSAALLERKLNNVEATGASFWSPTARAVSSNLRGGWTSGAVGLGSNISPRPWPRN